MSLAVEGGEDEEGQDDPAPKPLTLRENNPAKTEDPPALTLKDEADPTNQTISLQDELTPKPTDENLIDHLSPMIADLHQKRVEMHASTPRIVPVSMHDASLKALLTSSPDISPIISNSSKTVASSTSSCQ